MLPIVQKINGFLADYILVFLLVAAGLVWELTDTANYLMVLPNVIGLVGCTALVRSLIQKK